MTDLVERLRDCAKVTFSAGLHGVEADCKEAAYEIVRMTRELDNAAICGRAILKEAARYRAALERISVLDTPSDGWLREAYAKLNEAREIAKEAMRPTDQQSA